MDLSTYRDKAVADSVRDHFVNITVHCTPIDGAGDRNGDDVIVAYSAFVIDIGGVWCLVTAGHVINDPKDGIEAIRRNPRLVVRRIALADCFSLNAVTKKPTPFTYEDHQKIDIDRDGIDIAIIPLREFFRRSLEANGVQPLPYEGWDRLLPEYDSYVILGTPAETIEKIEQTERRGPGISALLAMVPVKPCPIPAEHALSVVPRFCGELPEGLELESVKGMSGGPILGIRRRDSGLQYTCLAVQASWHKPTRLVFGTPVGMVVHFIKLVIAESLSKGSSVPG